MGIRRAMPTVHTTDLRASEEFYRDFLGFEIGMREPDFLMLRSPTVDTTQLIVVGQGANDNGVQQVDISIEVGDVDAAYRQAQERELDVVYPITDEPWGIRRFFVRDPNGLVVNVASHRGPNA